MTRFLTVLCFAMIPRFAAAQVADRQSDGPGETTPIANISLNFAAVSPGSDGEFQVVMARVVQDVRTDVVQVPVEVEVEVNGRRQPRTEIRGSTR